MSRASTGGELPADFEAALERAGEIVEAVRRAPRAHAGPTTTTCWRPTSCTTASACDHRLGVRGMGDRFFDLGNFAVNNEFDDGREDRLLEAYFGEAATPRRQATLNLFRFMSDLREAMWGVLQSVSLGARLRLPRVRRQALRPAGRDRRRPALPHLARGGRWRSPGAPELRALRDHWWGRRAARRSPTTSPDSAGTTWFWSSATSSPPARPSTRPGSSASCAARSR